MAKKELASVTMRVRVGENEFEVTGPSDYVEKKIDEFLARQKSAPTANAPKDSPHLPHVSPPSAKGMSESQFFKKVGHKSDIDRVLASGYYLEKYKKQEKFIASEASEIIRLAKIPPPKNPNDAVNKNIRKGFMMAAGDKDGKIAFVLTTDGEEAIEASFKA